MVVGKRGKMTRLAKAGDDVCRGSVDFAQLCWYEFWQIVVDLAVF